jgi:hypothetical protein
MRLGGCAIQQSPPGKTSGFQYGIALEGPSSNHVEIVATAVACHEGDDGRSCQEDPMSYAEAKQIALLRLEIRACWERLDRDAAGAALAKLVQAAGNDNELCAEVRRWMAKLD